MSNRLALITLFLVGCAAAPQKATPLDDAFLNGYKAAPAVEVKQAPPQPPPPQPIIVKVEVPQPPAPSKPPIETHMNNFEAQEAFAEANGDVPSNWTGAVIYHTSWCQYCPRLIADLTTRATRQGWKIGVTNDCHWKLIDNDQRRVNFPVITQVPTVVYFVKGVEAGRVEGYSGSQDELTRIIARHPKADQKAARQALGAIQSQSGPLVAPYMGPVLSPRLPLNGMVGGFDATWGFYQ